MFVSVVQNPVNRVSTNFWLTMVVRADFSFWKHSQIILVASGLPNDVYYTIRNPRDFVHYVFSYLVIFIQIYRTSFHAKLFCYYILAAYLFCLRFHSWYPDKKLCYSTLWTICSNLFKSVQLLRSDGTKYILTKLHVYNISIINTRISM